MKQKYQLQTLTPVHIGSGETLNQIDGYYANGRWYHIDLDRVLAHPSTDLNALTSEMSQHQFRWHRYLSDRNIDPSECSDYSLICPQSPETVEIREAIKAIDNRPYIPGSTLKGALRTALLGEFLSVNDDVYEKSQDHIDTLIDRGPRGNPRREQPARQIEQFAFGKDPNHDLLRALQVSDTQPLQSDVLEIGLVWTLTLNGNNQLVEKRDGGQEYKHFLQQFQAHQRLTFTLKIDDFLFRNREKARLRYSDSQEQTLRDIAEVCRSDANALMQRERKFYDDYNLSGIANIYDELIRINNKLPEGAFLLQIGWGTGYHANTVTSMIADADADSPEDEDFWMDLRERFRLGQSRSRRDSYDERAFPKTRRILYRGRNPIFPLGWVKIAPLGDS